MEEKRIVTGILAHVDSGKTTLSEALLYHTGHIRTMGRVDHKNAFLDTDTMEKERGITIYAKQAVMETGGQQITLLDTPGHVDFSTEAERVLWVLDYAILVISGLDGVQSHTLTLWNLLKKHHIPVFIFVNKMDISLKTKEEMLVNLKENLSAECSDFVSDSFLEDVALTDEDLAEIYLETGEVKDEYIINAIYERKIFPCFFGSALKGEGVEEFLSAFAKYTADFSSEKSLGAKVFKISEDEKGARLTHLKITGGRLAVRDKIEYLDKEEKISEIRIYSGAKYKNVQEAVPGDVCCVCGLSESYAGMGIGSEEDAPEAVLESVFTYKVTILDGTDKRVALAKLRKLEEEENSLNVIYNETLSEIHIRIMGEVQLEVMQRILRERFSLDVIFEQGSIVYKETIATPSEGVGHYEPLRHYSEVHLLLEPLKRGSGLVFEADCREDDLSRNWQRLILTHLKEKNHKGVLTGSPITDMKITLKSGKAHIKHTEGGDFRQATYRAVRHGLRCAENVLLEPFYAFNLVIPTETTGRAMTDLEKMNAKINSPSLNGDMTLLTGQAPVRKISEYQKTVTSYTRGEGKLTLTLCGYDVCADAEEVIEKIAYDCDADIANTADSVFCKQGAGFSVPWYQVTEYMHLESILAPKTEEIKPVNIVRKSAEVYDEDELMRIFERTYGKIVRKNHNAMKTPKDYAPKEKVRASAQKIGPGYLLVDGYNVIFAWEELKKIAKDSLEDARNVLIDKLGAFKALRPQQLILVFDAYKVKGNRGEVEKVNNITVVYTKEAQTADAYIEKTAHELGKKYHVQVATSDSLEQMIILGSGAQRISAAAFIKEIEEVEKEIQQMIREISGESL